MAEAEELLPLSLQATSVRGTVQTEPASRVTASGHGGSLLLASERQKGTSLQLAADTREAWEEGDSALAFPATLHHQRLEARQL